MQLLWFPWVLISYVNFGPKKVKNLKLLAEFIIIKIEAADRMAGNHMIIMEEMKKNKNLVVLIKDQLVNKINEDHEIKVYLNKKLT